MVKKRPAKDLRRKTLPTMSPQTAGMLVLIGVVAGSAWIGAGSLAISRAITGRPDGLIPANPVAFWLAVLSGKVGWSTVATGAAIVLTVVFGYGAWLLKKVFSKPTYEKRVDNVKRFLADSTDLYTLSRQSVEEQAKRFLPEKLAHSHPGLRFGQVPGNPKQGLWSGWEDLYLVIFGPRAGKTVTQVIPAIFSAPGNVVTTSNKSDIIDQTLPVTGKRGTVWVFDPQNIAPQVEQPQWFFDPLDLIRRDEKRMDSAAIGLAEIFRASETRDSDQIDYWASLGRALVSGLFLAAAIANRPITDTHRWVNDQEDRTPIIILRESGRFASALGQLEAAYNLVPETRSGVFSQGSQMLQVLSFENTRRWITPSEGAKRFDAEHFVRQRRDTLYVLSREGADSASALTTALVASVMQAAERYGESSPNGRLPIPLVGALDEAANVVRWPDLPALYSHYGSRGIILMTILQSYAQGIGVWGEHGMEALWSASAILMYGGGVRDEDMLRKLESLIGTVAETSRSSSSGRDQFSVNTSYEEKQILTVAELAALDRGRAVVLSSGRRPILAELTPWWNRKWPKWIETALAGKIAAQKEHERAEEEAEEQQQREQELGQRKYRRSSAAPRRKART